MATIKQNSFSETREAFKEISNTYNIIRIHNFDSDDCFKGDSESLWDGMWNLSSLFDDIQDLKSSIQHMLNNYNNWGTKEDYEELLQQLNCIESDVIYDYKNIKNAIGSFSDREVITMGGFKIENYI